MVTDKIGYTMSTGLTILKYPNKSFTMFSEEEDQCTDHSKDERRLK